MALITREELEKIDRKIEEVYLTTGMSYPENNLLEIIKKLNIEVFLADFGKISMYISGFIDKGKVNEKTQILLNKNESSETRTFTLAHELGHFLLHPGNHRLDANSYGLDTQESKEEAEANYFAASLLLPKDKLTEVLNKFKDIKLVSEYFGVPEAVVLNRLRWMHLN